MNRSFFGLLFLALVCCAAHVDASIQTTGNLLSGESLSGSSVASASSTLRFNNQRLFYWDSNTTTRTSTLSKLISIGSYSNAISFSLGGDLSSGLSVSNGTGSINAGVNVSFMDSSFSTLGSSTIGSTFLNSDGSVTQSVSGGGGLPAGTGFLVLNLDSTLDATSIGTAPSTSASPVAGATATGSFALNNITLTVTHGSNSSGTGGGQQTSPTGPAPPPPVIHGNPEPASLAIWSILSVLAIVIGPWRIARTTTLVSP